jgi:hypothetical protein
LCSNFIAADAVSQLDTLGAAQAGAGSMTDVPHASIADHFMEYPGCGEWFDMRDLGQVFEPCHDMPVGEQMQ